MSTTSGEAILLIHGFEAGQRDSNRERLIEGLEGVHAGGRVARGGATAVDGLEGVRLTLAEPGREARTLDVYEAYWGDLVERLSQQPPRTRALRGLEIVLFWALSPIWLRIWRYKWLTFNMITAAVLVCVWYYGALAMFFSAVGHDPSLLSATAAAPEGGAAAPAVESFTAWLRAASARLGEAMGSWKPWAAATVAMGLLPVSVLVDLGEFARRYLLNEPAGAEIVGLRGRIRGRVLAALYAVAESGRYQRVTVVAHSFGVMAAIDALASYRPAQAPPLRLVTLAGPVELLMHRAAWVRDSLEGCAQNPRLAEWKDFYCSYDWFGLRTPFREEAGRREHHHVGAQSSLSDRVLGRTHRRYFAHAVVVQALLAPPPARVAVPALQRAESVE